MPSGNMPGLAVGWRSGSLADASGVHGCILRARRETICGHGVTL
jgi:hypothetical protein